MAGQIDTNKNQLQELLLGVALVLRDLEFSCFVDHNETPVPGYIIESCMEPDDVEAITALMKILSDHLE